MPRNMKSDAMETAWAAAQEIQRKKKHVSVVYKKNQIIAIGTNDYKTHPQAQKLGYRFSEVHSELDAYNKVPFHRRTGKLILLNFRFNRFGDLRMSKPCRLCMPWCSVIFDQIYYSDRQGCLCLL